MFGLVLLVAGAVRRLAGVTVPAVNEQPVHKAA
jgi:hypothetical protein